MRRQPDEARAIGSLKSERRSRGRARPNACKLAQIVGPDALPPVAVTGIGSEPGERRVHVDGIDVEQWLWIQVEPPDLPESFFVRPLELDSSLLATYLERWDKQPFPDGEVHSYAGNFDAGARPHWRASGHIDWHSGPWLASYAAEYIGSYTERVQSWALFHEFEPFDRRVDPVLYHDIEAGFKFDSGVSVRAVITNATDEDPPYLNIAPANTDVSTYRLLGRSYFLELRYQVE